MKPSEMLTVIANYFSESGTWAGGAHGYLDPYPEPACLDGERVRRFGRNCASDKAYEFMCEAVKAREPDYFGIGVFKWNDRICRDHRDAADLCHEAAFLAKEAGK